MYNDDDELQQLDHTKLRYALYVRKSTDDESKQLRSLEDQIAECETLAKRLGIRLVKPYLTEKKSAKIPSNRPVFTQMLKDIRHGTYDGIVAWHPDRLARNMREGGELIDMLDEKILKDLRFVTHYFTNDASGKMLLGMAFVLSKHYSDDLSQKVTRGVRRSFQEENPLAPQSTAISVMSKVFIGLMGKTLISSAKPGACARMVLLILRLPTTSTAKGMGGVSKARERSAKATSLRWAGGD